MEKELFVENCKKLESLKILYREEKLINEIFPKPKNILLKDLIDNSGLVKSKIDGEKYCLSNGKLERHLKANDLSLKDYLKKYENFKIYNSYSVNSFGFKKNEFITNKNIWKEIFDDGEKLFFEFRQIMTTMRSDKKHLMFFYGVESDVAEEIAKKSKEKRSKSHVGDLNGSFGNFNLKSNCRKNFSNEEFDLIMKKRDEKTILNWASKNDIDLTSFEDLKKLYYSSLFVNIHKRKALETLKKNPGLTYEQALFKYNSEKSKENYDAKNFYDFCLKYSKILSKEDFLEFENAKKSLDYDKMISLILFALTNRKKRNVSCNSKFGIKFVRSKLEKGVLYMLEKMEEVSLIKYEKTKIDYFSTEKNRNAKYIVDFTIFTKYGNFLIEVKPFKQYIFPDITIAEKKECAEKFAFLNNFKYIFITEKDLKYDTIRKKLQSN